MGEATSVAVTPRSRRRGNLPLGLCARGAPWLTALSLALGSVPTAMPATAQRAPAATARARAAPARVERTPIAPHVCETPAQGDVAAPTGTPALAWRGGAVSWARWPVSLGASGTAVDLIVVRIDPTRIALSLEVAREGTRVRPWTIEDTPRDALVAFNAGQFTDEGPWGWVLHDGREFRPPGAGALAPAVVVDSAGRVAIVPAEKIDLLRTRGGSIEAMQSYPALLQEGNVHPMLCTPGAVATAHRDIRFALGVRADGVVVLALSRYRGAPAGAGATVAALAERLPVGPTTLEMVTIMRRLGASAAVMLDGGLSAQLRVQEGERHTSWAGLRGVPLALVGRARGERPASH